MSKRPLLGSHQRSWIWGRNLVTETLRAGIWTPYELRLAPETEPEFRDLAESRGAALHVEPATRLTQLCGATDHQGVLAKMPPFPYAAVADILRLSDPEVQETGNEVSPPLPRLPRSPAPLFVVTDHLQDPYNFGAIVRSAECFGATGVFIPKDRQVGVTSQVARSSAGGINHVPIARVDDLHALAGDLKRRGVRLVAASEHAKTPVGEADLSGPVAVLIGNEGVGIEKTLLAKCDLAVAIPLAGRVGSLNAAVAAGILLYEVARRRRK